MLRRTFLKQTTGAALGGLLLVGCNDPKDCCSEPTADPAAVRTRTLDRIGVQLYTLRGLMQQDVSGTLAQVAEIGYDEVEFAGYFDHSPQQIRAWLDGYGLAAPASHISVDATQNDLAATLEAAQAVGHDYLIVAWLPQEQRTTLDDYRRWAAHFNEVGRACREAGMQFAYHNHDFEFMPIDGTVPYDLLLAETDADLVQMEIDFFWAHKAEVDPLAYFAAHPGRFPLSHVKDGNAAHEQTPVGAGVIDFADLFAHTEEAGMKHYFMEMDNPANPLADVRQSYEHLAQLRF